MNKETPNCGDNSVPLNFQLAKGQQAQPPAAVRAVPLQAVPVHVVVPAGDDGGSLMAPLPVVAEVTLAEAKAMSLTEPQRAAILKLTSGETRSAAAIAAGVTRTTLYRWLNHDPAFQAAYNAWQKDLVTTAQGQLLAASQEAIGVVVGSIRKGNAALAWKLLQSLGLTKAITPGSTDVRALQRKAELDVKRQDIAERREVNEVLMDDMSTIEPFRSPLE
jgi:hypothetical protein